jgi:hypothetical protein
MNAAFHRMRQNDPGWVLITNQLVPLGQYRFLTGAPTPFQRRMRVTGTFIEYPHSYHLAVAY